MSAAAVPTRGTARAWLPQLNPTSVVTACALGLLVVVLLLDGVTAAAVPVVWAFCFVVPGDLLRRAVHPSWSPRLLECIGVDFVGSCGLLTVFGGLLATVGLLERGAVVVFGAIVLAALGYGAARRGGSRVGIPTTVRSGALLIVLGAAGLCLFHIEPLIGDRISLGQLRSSVEVLQSGGIPATSWTYGTSTPFPFNYVFLNVIFSVVALVGGFDTWSAWKLIAGSLRLLQLGLFVIAWYLVGREILRRFRPGYVTEVCAALLPVLLLANLGLRSKFRDPLVEGFGLVLVGVAVWAVLRSTNERSTDRWWYSGIGVLAVSLTVGMHFPVFVEAVVLIGSWIVVAPRSEWTSPTRRSPTRRRREGPWLLLAVRRTFVYVAGVAVAFAGLAVLSGTTPFSPAAEGVSQALAYRAYLLYVGNPLSSATLGDFVGTRWSAMFILTASPFSGMTVVLAAIAAIGLVLSVVRDRSTLRLIAWWILAAALTAAYVGIGFYFGRTEVTPWNAITRNAFYLWFPISFAIAFGVRSAIALIEGRRGTRWHRSRVRPVVVVLLVGVLITAVVRPFGSALGETVRDHGWIQAPQMSTEGEEALRWLGAHSQKDAVALTTEVTFGSDLVSGRRMVTEGYATLESKAVTTSAVESLSLATEFLLPAHSPQILIDRHVDYVVAARPGPYSPGVLGGLPLLLSYYGAVGSLGPALALDEIPYLHAVHREGPVVVYRVDRSKLPTLTVTHSVVGQEAAPCPTDVCIDYQKIKDGPCPNEQVSARPNVCIIRRTGSTTDGQ